MGAIQSGITPVSHPTLYNVYGDLFADVKVTTKSEQELAQLEKMAFCAEHFLPKHARQSLLPKQIMTCKMCNNWTLRSREPGWDINSRIFVSVKRATEGTHSNSDVVRIATDFAQRLKVREDLAAARYTEI